MSYSERLWRASAKGDLKTVQSMVYGENSDVNMSNTAHGFTGELFYICFGIALFSLRNLRV